MNDEVIAHFFHFIPLPLPQILSATDMYIHRTCFTAFRTFYGSFFCATVFYFTRSFTY